MDFEEVADGVLVRRHRPFDVNAGLVLGDDTALVIDTRASRQQGEELRAAIAEVTTLPVAWVVNTHVHWDHTFGNQAFPEATIIGHDRVRELLDRDGDEMLATLDGADWVPDEFRDQLAETQIVPPTVTTTSELSIDLGSRWVRIAHHGRGHTDSDVVVDVDDVVSFAGDLIEESAPPAFGDAFPRAWVATLDRIVPSLADVVVPGHGAVVDVDFVQSQRAEVAEAIERAADGRLDDGPWPRQVLEVIADRLAHELAD